MDRAKADYRLTHKVGVQSCKIYVEFAGKQYNITDLVDRAKADYRLTHKVGVQSCKIYVKPEEEAAYYVVNKVGGKLPL